MKAKNYVKVGLVISIVLHVGIFALGGYVMNNITKELNENQCYNPLLMKILRM